MDERNIPRNVFSGGINWDSREPFPPEDDERAPPAPSSRDARPRRPGDVATYGSPNVPDFMNFSQPGHRLHLLDSAGAGAGRNSLPDVPRAPGLLPKPQPWGAREPPNTASIYFPDNFSQPRKNVVSEFGRGVLTPLSVEIAVFVVHNTAKMTVTHFFYNESAEPVEKASYAFPVSSGCTLTDFSCRIGNRKVVAIVKPAAQARDKFAKAVREKRTAVLLEQDDENSEIIMAQLGNIPGETRIKTEFELVLLLERRIVVSDGAEASVTTLIIPSTIASRYGGSVAEANGAPPGIPEGVSITVDVVQSPELQDLSLWSPSHTIDTRSGTRNQKVQSLSDLPSSTSAIKNHAHSILKALMIDEHRLLDRDFVLEIKSKPEAGGPKAQAWLGQHTDPDLPSQQALMIHIPPSALSSASRSKSGDVTGEIVFLLDQSNSMEDKIGSLMKATRFLLQNIPCGWKFNIWRFGSTYTSLWPSSKERQEDSLKEAFRWLQEKCQGNMGGTELISALKAVLENASCPTHVLLLTDGQVWRLDEALELIKNTRRESHQPIRFFCLGIGDMISHALIEGLAESGGGYSDVIYFQDQRWGRKLVAMLASILAVHTNPIRVLLNGTFMPESTLQSPGIISRLNVLQEDNIFLLVDSHHMLDIKSVAVFFATDDGEEMEIDLPVLLLDKNDTTIHKLAARALLNDLKLGRSKVHMEPKGSDQAQRIKDWAEDIACSWKLLSKWTSFIMAAQEDSDGLLMPPTSGSALMQKRLLTRTSKFDSRHIQGRSEDDERTSSSSEHYPKKGKTRIPAHLVSRRALIDLGYPIIEEGNTVVVHKALGQDNIDSLLSLSEGYKRSEVEVLDARFEPREIIEERTERVVEAWPPLPPMAAPHPRGIDDDEDEVVLIETSPLRRSSKHMKKHTWQRSSSASTDHEPSYRSTEESEEVPQATKQITKIVTEELDKREREQKNRTREEEQVKREDEWRAKMEREITSRREAEEYAKKAEERTKRETEAITKSAEEGRVRRETEKCAAERGRLEAERCARDEELHARKEAETRREFQKGFQELARMIAELAERVRRKEVEDREAARKDAEERARKEDEECRRADWEREKRTLEREMREAARAEAERRPSQTTAQVGRRLGYARPVEEEEETTPQTGQGANGGRGRAQTVGEERVWRLGVLIQDSMGRWERNEAVARIGRLLSGDESQGSGILLFLALLTVAGMALFAMTFVFFFVSSFMFLSSWMIALCILQR